MSAEELVAANVSEEDDELYEEQQRKLIEELEYNDSNDSDLDSICKSHTLEMKHPTTSH